LDAKDNLYFNVSHQGDFVVLAAESSANVGIDVMKTEIKGNQTVAEFFHTMRRQFTSYEWQTIKQRPSERKQLEMFMRHWCLKESYVKALGVGIGLLKKLQSIEFHITPQSIELDSKTVAKDTKLFLDNKLCDDWCFEETKLDEEHQVAVALQRSNLLEENEVVENGSFTILTIGDLLPLSIPISSLDEQLWKTFETKRESPWKRCTSEEHRMFLYITIVVVTLVIYFKFWKKSTDHIVADSSKYVFITGCDSGFGLNTAKQLDSLGFTVIATCLTDEGEQTLRNSCSKNLHVIKMDVTDTKDVQDAYDYVKNTMKSEKDLWSVINNAGVSRIGPLDWQTLEEMKKMADVNLWGLIDVTKTFLPLLKMSGGHLINVSSIGGRLSLPYMGAYCASKFAVEAFTDALRVELCNWGIKTILVEPGFFKTNMIEKNVLGSQLEQMWSRLSEDKKLEYGEEFLKKTKDNMLSGVVDICASPNVHVVTEAIVDAVTSLNPKIRYVLGWDANLIWLWLSRLSSGVGDFLKRHISKIEIPDKLQRM
ncbi:short-chain dehydrogenase reductase family 9C member 7-like, partial [Paramuricea clavata]